MTDKDELIQALGLQALTPEEQDAVYDDFTLEVGAAVSDGLSDEQMTEFKAIIDGHQEVINAWLAAHDPAFRDADEYQQLEVGYREDPEKVPADKVYATLGWIRVNRPDYPQIVARVTAEFRHMIAASAE